MSRYRYHVMCDGRHVAADVLASVVDARVGQTQKCDLDQLAKSDRHESCVFCSDSELHMVEHVEVLQESALVREDLTHSTTADATRDVRSRHCLLLPYVLLHIES